MNCCVKKGKNTRVGVKGVRVTKAREWETRNKFRCLFCGGSKCNHEDWTKHPSPAIQGLNSDWITESILATQRLSSRLIEEFQVLEKFKEQGINAVFNLQLPGEHPYCGDGLRQGNSFTYLPDEIFAAGMYFYNFGWRDMHAPTIDHMVNIVHLMSFVLDNGGKLAVHCHAGYGRTGLAIAAYLLFSSNLTVPQVVDLVRSKRSRCIQTKTQCQFLEQFHKYLLRIRVVFPEKPLAVQEFLANQSVLVHGNDSKVISGLPKLLHTVCSIVKERFNEGHYTKETIGYSFVDPEHPHFSSPLYQSYIGNLREANTSIDETCTVSQSPGFPLLEKKLEVLKHKLNSWDWQSLKEEKDARVLVQLMLDWLENAIAKPLISEPRTIEKFFELVSDGSSVSYSYEIKGSVKKHQFRTLEIIAEHIVKPLKGFTEEPGALVRLVIALTGAQETQNLNERKLVKAKPEDLSEPNKFLVEILTKWAETFD